MEDYFLNNDITVFYITAKSFPDGIEEAHQKLHALVPPGPNRNFYGISRPENKGAIIYKAAVEVAFAEDAKKLGCEPFVIKKGQYVSIFIQDYLDDPGSIDKAFKKLTADPRIDPHGYCIEMYLGIKDLRCMVKIKE